jgi:hypothetical protein
MMRQVMTTVSGGRTSSQTNLAVAVCGSTDVDVSEAPGAPDEYGDMFPEPGGLAESRRKSDETDKAQLLSE